jgi:thiol-disulfide isomerase/thioredoxin
MMKNAYFFIGVAAAVAIIGWLFIARTGQDKRALPSDDAATPTERKVARNNAPNFSLQDYSGRTVNLSDFSGKPIVINSWAAWCPFCKKELVDFAVVQKEFGDTVVIIAIDRAESLETAKQYTDELGVTNDLLLLLDPTDSFYQSIGGFSMPETIFVDRTGNIQIHKRGPMAIQEIREKIQHIISSQ